MSGPSIPHSAGSGRRGHLPIMPDTCVRELQVVAGNIVVDCTAGGGGHLERFVTAVTDSGRVIGIDRDDRAFQDDAAGGVAKRHPNVTLVRRPFSELEAAIHDAGATTVDVVFADLGVSSFQLDEGERGFSFRHNAPLDMRMDRRSGETAAELIARLDEEALANIIYLYGDERQSRRIAKSLKWNSPQTTDALKSAVVSATGPARGKIHPATKTFQALRIAVNGELDELQALLAALPRVLSRGGRAGFLTFHSLEDRLVKRVFKGAGFFQTSKKPLVADEGELDDNPRARSAKLRVAIYDPERVEARKKRYQRDASDDDSDNDGDDTDTDDTDDVDAQEEA